VGRPIPVVAKLFNFEILDISMYSNDADAPTIGVYLSKLLLKVWYERECFDGKRPFGNSLWENEIYCALVHAGAVDGKLDDDGWLAECDRESADEIIDQVIRSMAEGKR
jgi:hypothetical protein